MKKMPLVVFIVALVTAAIFDVISLIPFIGNMMSMSFIFFTRLSFWIAGYSTKGVAVLTGGTALMEFIPGISILPGCLAFVIGFYLTNKKAVRA